MKFLPDVREKLTMLLIVVTRTDAHSLRNQVGIESESDCLLGQSDRIFRISASDAGVKEEKSGGVVGEEGECADLRAVSILYLYLNVDGLSGSKCLYRPNVDNATYAIII